MGGEVDQETIDCSTPQELTGMCDLSIRSICHGIAIGMGEIHNIRIEAGMNHVLTFTTSQYSDLRWKFKSEGGDLMFKVEVKRNDENVVLVPHTRVWYSLTLIGVPSVSIVRYQVIRKFRLVLLISILETLSWFTLKICTAGSPARQSTIPS